MLHNLCKFLIWVILKTFFSFQVKGAEYIPKKGAFILASNHVSFFDPPVVGAACPRRLNYMARHDLFFNRWFVWWGYQVGVFPVKRGSVATSAFRHALKCLNRGEGLLIFPEGMRQDPGTFGQAEAGIGLLAAKTNAPVIPALVEGTDIVLPKGAKGIRFHQITVYFGKKIQIERGSSYQSIAQLIMENIKLLKKILN